jgi:AraC-like DNA-binding protein
MFQLRSVCQSFACLMMDAERMEFEQALHWLPHAVPDPASLQEMDALNTLLSMCAVNAGTLFHRNYHHREAERRTQSKRQHRPCQAGEIQAALTAWIPNAPDSREAFERWARTFLCAFDATHPIGPVEGAAAILRSEFRNPPDLDTLARRVGSSKSNLTLRFHERHGISYGEYVTRVRLAWFTKAVRKPGSNAGQLAEDAGYRRYHNLCDALRARTGLTPHEIRDLTREEFHALQLVTLALKSDRVHIAEATRNRKF